ncbi:MAG: helix-turn-helix domain-containing protein, partial [Thermoanaerobaculia bacterium]
MLLRRDEQVREAAAKKAIQRIQHDREHKASARVKPLLVHIEGQLFKPRLNSTTMMEDCGVRDHAVSTRFTCDLGTAPRAYICKRRLETAAELLAITDWPIWKVGFMVCYPNIGTFGKVFKGWSGSTASDYRKAARKAAAEAGSLEQDVHELARALLQGEVGEMERGQRVRLARHLLSFDEQPPRTLAVDGAKLERGLALSHWEDLRHLPAAEQQELVRRPYGLRTTALFDVLREKSRQQGRKDRHAGVRIAETALASLDGIAAHLTPDELANRRAQGCAWLANALRLALDYPAAQRAFTKARKLLPKAPAQEVLAEICDLEGELYLFQSKLEQALELKDQAVDLFRSL